MQTEPAIEITSPYRHYIGLSDCLDYQLIVISEHCHGDAWYGSNRNLLTWDVTMHPRVQGFQSIFIGWGASFDLVPNQQWKLVGMVDWNQVALGCSPSPSHTHTHTHTPHTTPISLPLRRDLRGCSNGYYVLGYRIYLNGRSHVSVDGPVTFETSLQCPTEAANNRLLIHVRYIWVWSPAMALITCLFIP